MRDKISNIIDEATKQFDGKEFTDEEVCKCVGDLIDANGLRNHPDIDKIEPEIINIVIERCRKKKIENVEKDVKSMLKSAALVVGGFATGMALSCVPGVGTIRMAAAGLKLGVSAVNFVSEKLGHGKIINISEKIDKLTEGKFAKKHPNIAKGIKKAKDIINSKQFNLFVNGVSAGYITGNVIEMVTGKTVLENIKSIGKKEPTVIETMPNQPEAPTAPQDTPNLPPNDVAPLDVPIDLTPIQGQTYDLSEIAKGYVASGNKDAVNLITSAGKDAVFDRAVTAADGQIWYHFKQANGLGYAWFPKDAVEEVIGKTIGR